MEIERDIVGEPVEALERIVDLAGEDEVADDDATEGEPGVVGGEPGAFLAVHFQESLLGAEGVVGSMGEVAGEEGIHVLEIREIDIDVGSQGLECRDIVVAVAVVNDGGEETPLMEGVDELGDAGGIVGGRDEAQDILTLAEHLRDTVDNLVERVVEDKAGVHLGARDGVVLAIDALEVAVGKEEIADAVGAADGGFFALVVAHRGDLGSKRGMAKTELGKPVGRAMAGAGRAVHSGCKFVQKYDNFCN